MSLSEYEKTYTLPRGHQAQVQLAQRGEDALLLLLAGAFDHEVAALRGLLQVEVEGGRCPR